MQTLKSLFAALTLAILIAGPACLPAEAAAPVSTYQQSDNTYRFLDGSLDRETTLSCTNNALMDIGSQQSAESDPALAVPPADAAAAAAAGWTRLAGSDGRPTWAKSEGGTYLYSSGSPYRTIKFEEKACASTCPPELRQYAAGQLEEKETAAQDEKMFQGKDKMFAQTSTQEPAPEADGGAAGGPDAAGFATGTDLSRLVAGNDVSKNSGAVGRTEVPAEVPLTYDNSRKVEAQLGAAAGPMMAPDQIFDGARSAQALDEKSLTGKPNMVITPNSR